MPDFKTIADFRKDNGPAIRATCRQFVMLCRRLDLFSETVIAIDGSRFKAKWLSRSENLASLADLPGQWIDKVHQRRPPRTIVLDMDSSESPTYGEQEGSAYNGHFGCTCYHPLFVFNQLGDVERCALRAGNVHSAAGWRDVLEPVVVGYRGTVKRLYFRGDAAFANPEMYEFLEAERIGYTIRLPINSVLQRRIGYLLKRPVGRPPHEVRRYYASFTYQAQSWNRRRRVVAKVEWHPGQLYPTVGFIVTNLARPAEWVVAFYNQRGTAEQWIKEGKGAIKWTRLSCRTFAANAVRLQLHALAYNLGNFMRTLAMPKTAEPWSLTSLREKLIKIGAKVVSHGRYVTFHMWTAPSLQGVLQCFDQIACVPMSGLFVRSHMNAGQDGFRNESSKQMGDLIEGHWNVRDFSRRGSIDHTICSLSCKFWHRLRPCGRI